MTEQDFIAELIDRHNNVDTDAVVLKDIGTVVRNLTDANRKDLFEWYVETWRGNGCPRAGFFAERLRDTGKKHGTGHARTYGAWICGKCETKYSLNSGGCPRCGSGAVGSIYPDIADPRVVQVKPECWTCRIYHDENGQKFGPECQQWGTGDQTLKICQDCRCKECCSYEYRFRKGFAGDSMPWIDVNYWRKNVKG